MKEILVKCDLFDSSLDSDGLAGAILYIIKEDLELEPRHWQDAMLDCCAANTAALNKVAEKCNVHVHFVPCASHGLNNTGKRWNTQLADKF